MRQPVPPRWSELDGTKTSDHATYHAAGSSTASADLPILQKSPDAFSQKSHPNDSYLHYIHFKIIKDDT